MSLYLLFIRKYTIFKFNLILGTTSGDTQALLLATHLGISSGGSWGTIWGAKDQAQGWQPSRQGTLLTVLSLQPENIHFKYS